MKILRTLPAVFSLVLLGAHYLRSGQRTVVVLCLVFAVMAFVRRSWAAWGTRLALVAGAGVWSGTLVAIVSRRQANGEPWGRTAVILGTVAILAVLAAMVLPGRGVGGGRDAGGTVGGDSEDQPRGGSA
jgi:hypothetical protein